MPYVRAIRAHPLLIAATVLVAIAASVAIAKSRSPQYKATAEVLVTPLSEGGGNGAYTGLPVIASSAAEPTRTLETAASVLKSPQANAATARTIPGWGAERVGRAIAVEPRGESDIVTVTATAGSAAQARRLANAYAHNALAVRSAELSRDANALIAQLQVRERALRPSDTTTQQQLAAQITNLVPVADGHDPNFSLLQAATLPAAPTQTSTSLIVALALIAGLVIGVGAALAIEFSNRRVRDEDEALSIYPLPVLARVPQLPRGRREAASLELVPPRVREVFRTLQVQLPLGTPGNGRSIMFTSASMGDGKTASAINLALVLAAAGRRVILFDFDLRKPDVGRRLGLHTEMMDLFRTGGKLDEVLVQSPATPGLRVISTTRHEDVTPLLEAVSRRLPELLEEAVGLADYVIIDTAPLGQVSDALRVAAQVDEILLVVRATNTDRAELEHTRELLERMGHTPSGILFIGETTAGSPYGVYGAPEGSPQALAAEAGVGRVEVPQPRDDASPGPAPRADGEPASEQDVPAGADAARPQSANGRGHSKPPRAKQESEQGARP